MKPIYRLCLAALAAYSGNAAAEPLSCHDSPRYFIVVRTAENDMGSDFLVKYKSAPDERLPCEFKAKRGDLQIPNEFAEYFDGVRGDLLLLDSGTGPEREMVIWDLKKREKKGRFSIGEGPAPAGARFAVPADPKAEPGYMEFWMETDQATPENCPEGKAWEADGLGLASVIETWVRLDLSNLKVAKSDKTHCRPRQ